MALTVGELVGYVDLKDKGFDSGVDAAGKALSRLQASTSTATSSMESTVTRSFAEIAKAIDRGVDPDRVISDLDRLEQSLTDSLRDMQEDADTFSGQLGQAIEDAFSKAESDARSGGQQTGTALKQGLDAGLDDVEETGKSVGEDLVQGVESNVRGNRLVGSGRELIGGLVDGMKEGGGGAGIRDVVSGLLGAIKGGGWLAAGALVGGLLIDGIKSAMEREDLFATLSARVGAFGPESERLGKIAGDLYAQAYGESLEDVTSALEKVYQNIPGASKLGDDALKKTAGQAITTGKVMDEDLGAVTAAVGQLMKTGLAKNSEEAFDILVRGQQEGINKSEDLLDTFNEYSTIFRDLGLSGQDALGLMSQGLKAGARDSDTVADGLKELDIRVKDLSGAKALKALGLDAKDMQAAFAKGGPVARDALDQILTKLAGVEDPAKRSQLAVQLFGTKAEDMAKGVNALNLDTAKTTVGGFENAVKTADSTLGDTLSGSSEQWSRSWENALSGLGGQILESIKQLFPSPAEVSEQWDGLVSWFTDTVGPFFADAWTAVKDKTVEIWNGIWDWVKSTAQAAGDWLGQVPGKIRDFFVNGWNDLQAKTVSAWESLKSGVTEKADALVEWVKQVPSKIGGFFSSGWSTLTSATSTAWENLKTAAVNKATDLITWMKGLPGKIKDGLGDLASLLLSAGGDLIQGLINGIQQKATDAVNAAKGVVQSAVDGAKNLLGIHSPSKVAAAEIGEPITAGIAQGILARQGDVGVAMSAVMTTARREASKGVASVTASLSQAKLGLGVTAKMGTIDATNHYTSSSSAVSPYTNDTARYNYAGEIISGSINGPSGGSGGTVVNVNMPNVTSLNTTTDIQQAASQFGFEYNIRATV